MLSLFVEINLPLKAELNYFPCQHCRNDSRRFRILKLIPDFREKVDKLSPNVPEYSTSFYIISLRLE